VVIFRITYIPATKTPVTATNNDIPAGEVVKSRYISTRELTATSIKTKQATMRNMTDRVFRLNPVFASDSVVNVPDTGLQYKSDLGCSKSSTVQSSSASLRDKQAINDLHLPLLLLLFFLITLSSFFLFG
jgi:hypothetical protein